MSSPSNRGRLVAWFLSIRWGEKSFIALYLSLLSGVVVALQYDAAAPLYSATTIELLIPFGDFWRSLHFYASQLFFLCFLCHFAVIVTAGTPPAMPYGKWLLLVSSLPVTILLLFTGYVLRADATGEAAGAIAENIVLSIPLVGEWLNAVLFSITRDGMMRVYANHLVGLGLLWLVLCWDHVRRYRVGFRQHGGFTVALLLFCLFVKAPLDSYQLGVFHIAGPWFFLGLQELLRVIQPFWAGVLFPLLFLVALLLVPLDTVWRRRSLRFAALWLGAYGVLSVISAFRGVIF